MPIRSREDAISAFAGVGDQLAGRFQEGMDEFYSRCGPIAHALEGWTRAALIRDLVKDKLFTLTLDDGPLRRHTRGNATSYSVGQFNFRIKKLDGKMRARTSRTKASRNFDTNQLPLILDDQPTTNMYFGYAPTENNPQSPPLYLVCNDETGRPAWEPIPVLRTAAPLAGEIAREADATPETGRVKVKVGKKRKAEGENG